jgi:hypothetical protein
LLEPGVLVRRDEMEVRQLRRSAIQHRVLRRGHTRPGFTLWLGSCCIVYVDVESSNEKGCRRGGWKHVSVHCSDLGWSAGGNQAKS